jgi:hypothetical protein
VLLAVDPRLIFQAQEPVFFWDGHFAKRLLSLPGGVNDLLARFLSQFFYFRASGAVLLVAISMLAAWLSRRVLRLLGVREPIHFLHWIPAILILALHSHYLLPLVFTLGWIWSPVAVVLFIRVAPSSPAWRCLTYAGLQACLYTAAAGQAFVFTAAVVLHELLVRRRPAESLIHLLVSGAIPYAAVSMGVMLSVTDAYTLHLSWSGDRLAMWLLWCLYGFLPLAAMAAAGRARVLATGRWAGLWDRLTVGRPAGVRRLQAAGMLCIAAIAGWFSYEADGRAFLEMDYYAHTCQWERVIECARRGMAGSSFGLFEANRALYHCGRLADDLFSLPQRAGGKGLFLPSDQCQFLPLRASDLFLDLGLVNEAQHWAHEAMSVTGETAWNLQRLVQVNEIKADQAVADKYLARLRQTFWYDRRAGSADRHGLLGQDPSALPDLAAVRANMPVADFLCSPSEPERSLEEMAKNTRNKMAFEYLMAYCLLEGDLSRFVAHLGGLKDLGYSRVPRHFEEALLIYLQVAGQRDVALPAGLAVSQQTRDRFADFNRILSSHGGDRQAARLELAAKYEDTYWFYAQYYYKPGGS